MELILFLALCFSGYQNIKSSCEKKEVVVKKIGVCSKMGECKVLLSDGKYKNIYLPMIGQKVVKYKCN